jgi:hypothetical protein
MRYNQQVIVEGDEAVVTGNCTITGRPHSIRVPLEGLVAWEKGALIQHALPTVSLEDREFLISGTSPEGWRIMFPEEEEEV